MNKKKLFLTFGIILLVVLATYIFKQTELERYLTLDYIKEQQTALQSLYASHKLAFIAGYMGIYITVTALSIPGAVVMTLAAGAIFGLLIGTIVVSFASTIGATCAFLISRGLLRNYFQNKFQNKLKAINEGIKKEGSFYLFALRLVPAFPFFLINIVMGLTPMPALTFFWVSQLGMLAGTVAYVNAGKEIAKIESLSGILSPGILIAFAILGLLPLLSKWFLRYWRRG